MSYSNTCIYSLHLNKLFYNYNFVKFYKILPNLVFLILHIFLNIYFVIVCLYSTCKIGRFVVVQKVRLVLQKTRKSKLYRERLDMHELLNYKNCSKSSHSYFSKNVYLLVQYVSNWQRPKIFCGFYRKIENC